MAKAKAVPTATELPAGAARVDALKRQADELTKVAEELVATGEVGSVDPAKLEVDREIRQVLDMSGLEISNPNPGMHYAWVYRDPYNKFGGRFVMTLKSAGWQVVGVEGHDDKEAIEHKFVDGTRVIGDVVLMRISKEKFRQLQFADLEKRRRQQSVDGSIGQLAELAAKHGVPIHTTLSEPVLNRMQARRLATQRLDKRIREGTVPGALAPGV